METSNLGLSCKSQVFDDHFLFKRYWVNDEFFDRKNGPVFLMIGGEGEENPVWMKKGNWVVLAQKYVSQINIVV